ncbi:MAG TPA: hypothetical protein DGT21_08525 [Armatimonadetes bacterium]|nr:hypothetical protein [Armatimonadota bacterium]
MEQDTRPSDFHRPTPRESYSPRSFSVCRDAGGRPWAAWHATEDGRECIRVLASDAGGRSEALTAPGLHFEPDLAADPAGGVWCAWSQRDGACWRVVARHRDGEWGPEVWMPAGEDEFAFHVAAECDGRGRLWVAYTAWSHGREPRVRIRRLEDGEWSDEICFDVGCRQMRPVLAAGRDGAVWVAFAAYANGGFRVVTAAPAADAAGRLPVEVPVDPIEGRQQLFPDLCIGADGMPWLAWVTCTDVVRDGVVGRQATLDVARRGPEGWRPAGGPRSSTVAHLDWGMLPVETYWGYNGLRYRPQLCAHPHDMWVFWERHRSETSIPENVANGQFCGCRHDGSGWGPPQLVHNGGSCFTIGGLRRLEGETIE